VKVLYVAPFGTRAYFERHGDVGFQLGGLRKAGLTIDALTLAGLEVCVLSSVITHVSRLEWRRQEDESWTTPSGATVQVRYPSTLAKRPVGGIMNMVRAPRHATRILEEFRPDLVWSYNAYVFEALATLTLRRRLNVPVVMQVEDLPLARRRKLNLKPWLDQRCWPHMTDAASAFTAVNQAIGDLLPRDKPVHVVPGIIDDRLVETAKRRDEPFSRSERTLGYFGVLSADKGVDVLLELARRLPSGWRLRIAGTGPLANDFASLASSSDAVEYLGILDGDALYSALCSCDVTVVPLEAITGGGSGVFPFKVLEYLVAGTHIISTPLPPIGELDLGFTQRWDGALGTLLTELKSADHRYAEERDRRSIAIGEVLRWYTTRGVSSTLSEMLESLTR
jgi:glycosyltransferase involved in cell wall biosynthesis